MKNVELDNYALVPNLAISLYFKAQTDYRHYNLSSGGEIVMFLLKDEDFPNNMNDMVLHLKDDEYHLEQINECHSTYFPLYYILLFSIQNFVEIINCNI